ncbi:dimethyl sulfoxide reductase anchor subunit, partial [Mycobacterium tuberculosis]|nr:dimethyl sulfoxide reductase anchor subunit [Mycobacterium tuberculosis]
RPDSAPRYHEHQGQRTRCGRCRERGSGGKDPICVLASPLRAFNSLNRVGASSLSNEIASGAIFFAVGGIGWLLAVCKKLPAGLRS